MVNDKNLPQLVGLRQAEKAISADDKETTIMIKLPFQANAGSIINRIVDNSTLSMILCAQQVEGLLTILNV